ncbi:MAG TPA: ribosomal protein L7/L12 [Gemmataceae bacterium]|nr:ribosomal protein L7/L12 [Gemmataceae bacterium]
MDWTPWLLLAILFLQVLILLLLTKSKDTRLEWKVDQIRKHLGLEETWPPDPSDQVKELARDPAQKIAAIKRYREETGAGLKEAKDVVDAWIAKQNNETG